MITVQMILKDKSKIRSAVLAGVAAYRQGVVLETKLDICQELREENTRLRMLLADRDERIDLLMQLNAALVRELELLGWVKRGP
jgi:hypothetical protein